MHLLRFLAVGDSPAAVVVSLSPILLLLFSFCALLLYFLILLLLLGCVYCLSGLPHDGSTVWLKDAQIDLPSVKHLLDFMLLLLSMICIG